MRGMQTNKHAVRLRKNIGESNLVTIEKYLESEGLLLQQQSGFRREHSYETALNWILIQWKEEIQKRRKILATFLDFKRAFEAVDTQVLLSKFRKYGITGKEYRWFESYLSDRMQRTKVNGKTSQRKRVSIGVPQGSVLGTTLFLIYINDINLVLESSKIALFADDALVYVVGDNIDECVRLIEKDLKKLDKWLRINRLKLNINKTKFMAINCEYDGEINMNEEPIKQVDEIKYLGVIVDKELKFSGHVNYICGKIGKKIGFLKRIRKHISTLTAIRIYNTIIRPHFEYCSSVLFLITSEQMNRLQKLQNKGMRAVLCCNRYTPIRIMLDTLKWMSVNERIVMNVLVLIFKIKNGLLPEYLRNYLNYTNVVQPYNLRQLNEFRLANYRTARAQNSLLYRGLKMFNKLRYDRNDHCVVKFKRYCIDFIRDNWYYLINNQS